MCGIFGVMCYRADDVPDQERLALTGSLLRHRGPDGHGCFAEPGVGLVHTRLALLDLSERSNQPFWDEERRFALVYNGEIYNFAELRSDLEREGIRFRTSSDTEVVLQSILSWGADSALRRFDGMFALGLYDTVTKSLLLARDRFGIKPLFVYQTPDVFIFSSEIRGMRPWVRLEPDLLSISGFLYGFSGPTKGFSFFKHVRIVEPGEVISVTRNGCVKRHRFFRLADFVDPGEREQLARLRSEALVDRLDDLLNQSVKAQLVADAPVGALCSGGVDSSVIMSIAARYHTNLAIFHANVVGPLSEYPSALRLAKHLKLDLRSVDVRDDDFIDSIPEVTQHFGHPFNAVPHSVPYLAVSRLVRSHGVKAVLSGEAADEYFLGYSYLAPDLRRNVGVLLRAMKRWLRQPRSSRRLRYLGPAYVNGGDASSAAGLVHALHNRFEILGETIDINDAVPGDPESSELRGTVATLHLLGYNLRSILHRNDSMGMAASIEARFPLLENRLARMAVNMPYDSKIRFSFAARDKSHYFFRDKWVMRKVAERYVPKEISRQEKAPFPTDAYSGRRMQIAPEYFDQSFIGDLFELGRDEKTHLFGRAPYWLKWQMLLLDVWAQVALGDTPCQVAQEKLRKHVSLSNAEFAGY